MGSGRVGSGRKFAGKGGSGLSEMSKPNTVDIERCLREKSEKFVLKPHLPGELGLCLKVSPVKFQQPAAILGEARDGISHYVGDSHAFLSVRHNLKETFRPLD